jgi:hypothetical protein
VRAEERWRRDRASCKFNELLAVVIHLTIRISVTVRVRTMSVPNPRR